MSDALRIEDWTTGAEAARLMGLSRQRVGQMADEGVLEAVRPWPQVQLISRRSVAEWLAGGKERMLPIVPMEIRRYVGRHTGGLTPRTIPRDRLEDLVGAFITERRPRWTPQRRDLWALEQAALLLQSHAKRPVEH